MSAVVVQFLNLRELIAEARSVESLAKAREHNRLERAKARVDMKRLRDGVSVIDVLPYARNGVLITRREGIAVLQALIAECDKRIAFASRAIAAYELKRDAESIPTLALLEAMRESFLVETREQSARESARKRAERIARKAAPKPAPKQATKAPGPISAVSFGAPLPAGYVENERSPRVAFIRSGFISKSDAHAVNTLRQRGVALRVVVGEQVFSDGIVSIPASRTDDFFAFVDTKAVGSNPRLLSTMRPAPRGFVPAPVLGGAL